MVESLPPEDARLNKYLGARSAAAHPVRWRILQELREAKRESDADPPDQSDARLALDELCDRIDHPTHDTDIEGHCEVLANHGLVALLDVDIVQASTLGLKEYDPDPPVPRYNLDGEK